MKDTIRLTVIIPFLFSLVVLCGCQEKAVKSSAESGKELDASAELVPYRDQAVNIIKQTINDKVGIMRAEAIEVVVSTNRRELLPTVRALAEDELPGVRFAAVTAIGDMGDTAGRSVLKKAVHDPDQNVRMAAAYSLAKLGDQYMAQAIRKLAFSEDQVVRANALLLLGKLGNEDDRKIIDTSMRRTDSNDKVKLQAMESRARLGDQRVYERLWALLISKHSDDRVMGIRCMGELGTVEARDAVVTMLDDEVVEVRLTAAEQLGRMGFYMGEPEVYDFFTKQCEGINENSMAHNMATMAAGRIGGPRLVPILIKRLESKFKPVRLRAAQGVLLLTEK